MRPWIIMGSAAVIALLMAKYFVWVIPRVPIIIERFSSPGMSATERHPPPLDMRATIEQPSRIVEPVDAGAERSWSDQCIAILTAPKTMRVHGSAEVVTSLFAAASQDAVDRLKQAAQKAADAINAGNAVSPEYPFDGLNPRYADAIRRAIAEGGGRQAAMDTLPAASAMTAHLSGPGFKITPTAPERQLVNTTMPTSWRWIITATDAGERILKRDIQR
jgi:hypothetical protein